MKNEQYETDKISKGIAAYMLGIAGIMGLSSIDAYNEGQEASKRLESVPYQEEIVRYQEINEELESTPTINHLVDEDAQKYFSEIAKKRDSLNSLEGFDEARQEYNALVGRPEQGKRGASSYGMSALFAGMIGGLSLFENRRSRKEKDLENKTRGGNQ